jgi:Flp pilus assembly protein TadD
MTRHFRGFILLGLSASLLALTACGTSQNANVSNKPEASRVNAILERAARDAKAAGNKAEAAVLLEQIYDKNPKDPAIATAFAQALREDEQLNRARQVLAPHTDGKDAFPDAVTELAMVQLALGQYKEAELTARNAVELDPNSGRAYLALGTALDAQNYHEQAEVAFRRGLDKWKGDPAPILNNLALNLASQNKLDQALDMLYKAKEISPGRQEIERNIRIISTLKEGADDYLTAKKKTAPPTGRPTVKKEEVKPDEAKKEPVKAEPKKTYAAPAKQEPILKEAKKVEEKASAPAAPKKDFGNNE